MSIDTSFNLVDFEDRFGRYAEISAPQPAVTHGGLSRVILSMSIPQASRFTHVASQSLHSDAKSAMLKANTTAQHLRGGGSCEGGISITFGGSDGTQVSGYVKGEAHDDDGNYAGGKAETDGEKTTVEVYAGHEE